MSISGVVCDEETNSLVFDQGFLLDNPNLLVVGFYSLPAGVAIPSASLPRSVRGMYVHVEVLCDSRSLKYIC